jgi:hypothetical protein
MNGLRIAADIMLDANREGRATELGEAIAARADLYGMTIDEFLARDVRPPKCTAINFASLNCGVKLALDRLP